MELNKNNSKLDIVIESEKGIGVAPTRKEVMAIPFTNFFASL